MQDEYDFTQAQRGKFYREGAEPVPPVHLEPDVLKYLQALAEVRGKPPRKPTAQEGYRAYRSCWIAPPRSRCKRSNPGPAR
jgi:hypothetical protein